MLCQRLPRPNCCASRATKETLANACNVSVNTIKAHVKSLVAKGALTPQGKQYRKPDGTWSTMTYRVELHGTFAVDHPCPPFNAESEASPNPFPSRKDAYTDADVWNV